MNDAESPSLPRPWRIQTSNIQCQAYGLDSTVRYLEIYLDMFRFFSDFARIAHGLLKLCLFEKDSSNNI